MLPGNTEAFTDTPIFARTSGYLTRWYVDIGARVKQGQLLAELETPELDQQLRQARADLATAESMHALAEITATRSQNLLTTHSVSTQERDNAVHSQAASTSTVESHRANVARLEQLQSFGKITRAVRRRDHRAQHRRRRAGRRRRERAGRDCSGSARSRSCGSTCRSPKRSRAPRPPA